MCSAKFADYVMMYKNECLYISDTVQDCSLHRHVSAHVNDHVFQCAARPGDNLCQINCSGHTSKISVAESILRSVEKVTQI